MRYEEPGLVVPVFLYYIIFRFVVELNINREIILRANDLKSWRPELWLVWCRGMFPVVRQATLVV